jgi:prepilin-type N-terminal cleavage/methylation domain-containing protein
MAHKQSSMRGFTLLELLVVVAIIGILAAVTLAALGSSRSKGNDSNIRANLKNAQSQAQLFYDLASPNTYEGVCATAGTNAAGRQVAAAERTYRGAVSTYADGTASTWNTAQCHDTATAWAAFVPLSASANGAIVAWCIDSTGASRQVTNVLAASVYVCP